MPLGGARSGAGERLGVAAHGGRDAPLIRCERPVPPPAHEIGVRPVFGRAQPSGVRDPFDAALGEPVFSGVADRIPFVDGGRGVERGRGPGLLLCALAASLVARG